MKLNLSQTVILAAQQASLRRSNNAVIKANEKRFIKVKSKINR